MNERFRVEHNGRFTDLTLSELELQRARRLAADWQFPKDEAHVEDLRVRYPDSGVDTGVDVHFLALCGAVAVERYLGGDLIVLEGPAGLSGRDDHEDMRVPHGDGGVVPVAVVATQGAMRDILIPYTKQREFLTSAVTILAWCNPDRPEQVRLAGWITPDDWLGKTNKRIQSQFGVLGYHAAKPTWYFKWYSSRSPQSLAARFGRRLA